MQISDMPASSVNEHSIRKLEAKVSELRYGLKRALDAMDGTVDLLLEHPVLRGHADHVREIHMAILDARNVLKKGE